MDQELIRFDLAVPQRPVEGLQHQRGLHGRAHGPTDHPPAVQVDKDSQVPPASRGADVGDVTGPAAIGGCWVEVLLQQVLSHTRGLASTGSAGSEPAAGLGLERGCPHQPSNAVTTHLQAVGLELMMDAWCAVEATVPLKDRFHLGRDDRVLQGPWARVLQPLQPGIQAAAGHAQLPSKPGHSKAIRQLADQPKTSRRQLLLGKVRCRQPEKILLPPEFPVFPTELDQFCPFIAGELPLIRRAEITAIDAGLANPLGQAAVGESQSLSHSSAAKALTETEGDSLSLLLRRKPASGHGRDGHRKTV